ncbi:MAG: RIP metalloprotease RseP [Patescibacteria group bacterium]|nr:RIP metalloprotease RseP [Patescibacteria group bacterium]
MVLAIISFLVVLGLLVLVHELGHFFAARNAGVGVEEFGIGFPPRAIGFWRDPDSKKWHRAARNTKHAPSTIYSLNWVPMGGFVRIKGEQGEQAADRDSFSHQGVGRRIWIISAGVAMNVVLAFVLISFGYAVGTPQVLPDQLPAAAHVSDVKVVIAGVSANYPAARAGLLSGDAIVRVDGQAFTQIGDIQKYLDGKRGTAVTVDVERDGKTIAVSVTPELLPEVGRAGFGVELVRTGLVRYSLPQSVIQGAVSTGSLTVEILRAFGSIITRWVSRQPVEVDISGPVGIAVISAQVVRMGWRYLLQFAALLSLNLAIINFLPLPALDGGRVMFLLVERFRGRAVSARLETLVHNIGFALLMLLVLLITYRDIARLLSS